MHKLMEANPAIADVWTFGGGEYVIIPTIVLDNIGVRLPPWKRGSGKVLLTLADNIVQHKYVGDYFTGDNTQDMPAEGSEYVLITSADGTVTYADSALTMLTAGEVLTITGPFMLESSGNTVKIRRVYGG